MPLTNISFIVPTEIRNQAADGDFVLMVDSEEILYKISQADFMAGLSIDNSSISKNYASVGDSNGVFYSIGTSENTLAWANPTSKGLVISSSRVGSGSLNSLVNRDNSSFYTNSDPNSSNCISRCCPY